MNDYLPEWFDEKEFEAFLTEGSLTRQAWVKGIKRWRRTRFMLRKMLGGTPMKYISRAMRTKHAVMARTAVQNARDIQSAQDREEKMDAARNFIRQEQVDVDFEKYLTEKLFSGSQTSFNLGTKASAGERASMRNPTGDPKKQAKLKKRIQRADKRKKRKIAFEQYVVEAEEKKQNNEQPQAKPKAVSRTGRTATQAKKESTKEEIKKKNFDDVLVVKTKNGNVKLVSRASLPSFEEGYTILMNEKPGDIKSEKNVIEYVAGKQGKFVATPTFNWMFGGKSVEEVTGVKEKEKEGKQDGKGGGAPQRRERRDQSPVLMPPERKVSPSALSYEDNESAAQIAQFIMDQESTNKLKKMGWFGKDGEELDRIQETSDQNPWIFEAGMRARQQMLDFASSVNPNLAGKDLYVLQLGGKQGCLKMSKMYESSGAVDRTSKADYIVIPKDQLEKYAKYLDPKKASCDDLPKELLDLSFGVSHKAGKSQLASSAITETMAVMEDVKDLLRENMDMLPQEIFELIEAFNKLKTSTNGQNAFRILNANFGKSAIQKMSKERAAQYDLERQSNLVAAQDYFNSTDPIVKEIKDKIAELMKDRTIQAAFVYAFASGQGKFDKNSLGKAQGMIYANEKGETVGTMAIPATFKDALKNEKFMQFVAAHKLNTRAKSWGAKDKSSRTVSVYSGRMEMGKSGMENLFGQQTITSSYDPLLDNKLDNLFEYTFLPPDQTISVENPPSAELMPQPQSPNSQMVGFSQFDQQEGDFKFDFDNLFPILTQLGLIEDIDFNVVDYTELGMKLTAMGNPIKNLVVVNGREYAIPVYNMDLEEGFFVNYDNLNDIMVEILEDGFPYDGVIQIFENELKTLIEGKRNYKREYRLFHGKPEQRAKRSKRVLARRKMAKRLGKRAIAGKDIDHKNGNALDNSNKNLRVRSINKNRADNGHSKKRISEMWGAGLEGSAELTLKWLRETPGQLGLIDPRLLKLLMSNKGKSR